MNVQPRQKVAPIYAHPNLYQVVNVQNSLRMHQIETSLRNEFAAGGSGELSPIDVWPELWLVDERDRIEAQRVVDEATASALEDWICSACGESNGGAFEVCWSCGGDRSAAQ